MKNVITKLDKFINEKEDWFPEPDQPGPIHDPYGEENWNENRDQKIAEIVEEFDGKFASTMPGAASFFIENFPTKKSYDDALVDEYANGMSEEEYDEAEESGNFDEYVLDQAVGDFESEFLRVDVFGEKNYRTLDVDNWCDFFNELTSAGW